MAGNNSSNGDRGFESAGADSNSNGRDGQNNPGQNSGGFESASNGNMDNNGQNGGGFESASNGNMNNNGQNSSGQNSGGFENGGFENGDSDSNGGFQGSETAGTDGSTGNGDDPFADLSAGRGGGQVMTAAERRAALDARLDEGLADFDGMILGERERVQAEADDAGSSVMSPSNGDGDESSSGDLGALIIAAGPQGSTGAGMMAGNGENRQGDFDNSNQESFPIPDDIPTGNDDDVVARQLREAAMHEPDPELREKLWNEYRNYTGLSIPDQN